MSRKKASAPPDDASTLTLRYELGMLPSTQHRAGLAGLALMVEWMARTPGRAGRCEVTQRDERGLTLELDALGLAGLFDELYAATNEEVQANQIRKDKNKKDVAPLRSEEQVIVDERTHKEKRRTVYFYPAVVPRAPMLVDLEPEGGEQGLWVRMWRNMIWTILRGVPATRGPFEDRANGEPTADAAKMWAQLTGDPERCVDLASTYYLGAMDVTAENVGFTDLPRNQFLLHFWPYVAQVYVPQVVDVVNQRTELLGFALAIPDVAQLDSFCDAFRDAMKGRGSAKWGYRPKEALIDLAEESALDAARRLSDALTRREGSRDTGDLVFGFDVVHVNKEGNNVRVLSNTRITPTRDLVGEYDRLRGRLWDPVFRKERLLNLVNGRRWYAGFDRHAETLPYKSQVIGSRDYGHDARVMFEEKEKEMSQDRRERDESLDLIVLDVVRSYVLRRAEARAGFKYDAAKDNPAKLKDLNEERARFARDAFLAVRSRNDADFEQYFVSTLCAVPQFLNEARFRTLHRALREHPDDVRTLTMLALSASGYQSNKDA